jgi:hypothetical protein
VTFLGYALDIHAHDALNGAALCRLTLAEGVSIGFLVSEAGFGESDLQITIHSDHALCTAANFHENNLAKLVVLTDGGDVIPDPQPGWFLTHGDFAALSEREQGGRKLTFKGPHCVSYLDRMILREIGYTENPDVPRPEVRGGTNVDGMWTFGVGDHPWGSPGAIMVRVLEEGFYEPGTPLADATWTFDRDEDSAGTAWPDGGVIDETWEFPIGSDGIDVLMEFLRSGDLHWRTTADLEFRAYKNDPGVDRTSATFAADKVRFAAGVNIADGTTRKMEASQKRKGVLVKGGDEVYEFVGAGPADVQWLDYIESVRTRNTDRLHRIGQRWLDRTAAIADAPTPFRHIVADDELNGRYVPFVHYQPGDTVTIHTGTGDHDFNNFAIPIAAVRVLHDAAGNWFGMPELGAQSISGATKAAEARIDRVIRQARAHTHPELLCPNDLGFIASGPGWKALVLGSEPAGWRDVGFDDSAWEDTELSGGGPATLDMMRPESAYVAGQSILYRREYWIEEDDLSGADVAFLYAIDNIGTIYVNGVEVAALSTMADLTNLTSDHATTLPRSAFHAGYNVVAVATEDDGLVGTKVGLLIEMTADNGQGRSHNVARCDKHYRASEIHEDTYGDLQSAVDAILAGAGGAAGLLPRAVAITAAPAGGWEAHTKPVAAYSPTSERTYIVYIRGDNGDVCIGYWDHRAGTWSGEEVLRPALELDDHAFPGVLVMADGTILTWYAQHNGAEVYLSRSDAPEDISAFTETDIAPQLGGGVNGYTYVSIAELRDLGELFLLVRDETGGAQHDGAYWSYSIGSSDATTWDALTQLTATNASRGPYLQMTKTAEDRVDFIFADGHSPGDDNIDVLHFYYDGAFRKTDGTAAGTLPLDPATEMTLIYDGGALGYDARYGNVGLGADGHPRCTFTVTPTAGNVWGVYGRWTGSAWVATPVDEDIEDSGTDQYGNGFMLDPDSPGRGWYSKRVDGVAEIHEFLTPDGGDTFEIAQLTSGSSVDQITPQVPLNRAAALPVVWLSGTRVDYLDWDLGITAWWTSTESEAEGDQHDHDDEYEPLGAVATHDADPDAHADLLASASGLLTVDAGTPTYDDSGDDVVVTYASVWGYDADGPYYDDLGVTAGEEAILALDPTTGELVLVPYTP